MRQHGKTVALKLVEIKNGKGYYEIPELIAGTCQIDEERVAEFSES